MERGDFVFYDRFLELCRRKGVVPTRAAVEAGISKSLVSKWKANEAKEPSPEVVRKLSEYFGVSPYEVLEDLPAGRGRPTLTERERRDVAREVERIMGDLENSGDLMFDGGAHVPGGQGLSHRGHEAGPGGRPSEEPGDLYPQKVPRAQRGGLNGHEGTRK